MTKIDKDVLTVLQKTRELIRSPRNWTQFASARDVESRKVSYKSIRAVKWHIMGAVLKNIDWADDSAWDIYDRTFEVLKEVALRHGFNQDISGINDNSEYRKKAFNNIHGILNHAINSIKKNII